MTAKPSNMPTRKDGRLIAVGILAAALVLAGGLIGSLHRIPADPTPAQQYPVPNGYDTLQAAYKVYVFMPNKVVDEVDDDSPGLVVVNGRVVKYYPPAAREAWLKRNAAALALVHLALTQKYLAPPDEWFMGSKYRLFARLLTVESHARIARNDWAGAFDTGLDIIALGHKVAGGAGLIGRLVDDAIQELGLDACRETISHLNASQYRQETLRLEAIEAERVPLPQSLDEQKAIDMQLIFALFHAPTWQAAEYVYDEDDIKAEVRWKFANYTKIVNDDVDFWNNAAAEAAKPYPLRGDFKIPRNSLSDPLIDNFVSRDRWSFLDAENKVDAGFLLTTLALRVFKTQHGRYPNALSELTPGILRTKSVDPFGNGGPLIYRRKGTGFLLYSIGPDGRDDDGRPIDHPDNKFNRHLVGIHDKGDIVAGINR